MKLIKTLKNLKFWSKNNKKKIKTIKNHRHSLPPPPPCCYCHHQHDGSHTFQPSAPPLPDWLDYEQQTYNQHLLASDVKFSSSSLSGFPISYQARLDPAENESRSKAPIEPKATSSSSSSGFPISYEARLDPEEEDESKSKAPIEPIATSSSSSSSYQQYMVENPVYTVPVLQSRRTERSAGSIGCVFNIGAHLFRCFFPCFRLREILNSVRRGVAARSSLKPQKP